MKIRIGLSSQMTLLLFFVLSPISLFASGLYDNDVTNAIQLTFADDDWDADLDAIYKQDFDGDGDYDRLLCTAVINGVQYEQVGVRYKGNSSYGANNNKNPFNIKLDHIIEQDYEGYGTLKLSNVYNMADFVLMGSYWQNIDSDDCQGTDLTGDGHVDLNDIFEFCADWLK